MSATTSLWRRLLKWGFILGAVGALAVAVTAVLVYQRLAPNLPAIDSLKNVQFQVPLRVYTNDGELIAEFGEKRREPVRIEAIPPVLKQAFLAAEDDRFYSHPGVDYQGILRAVINLIRTGERGQGGSTITMQVARNFFLSNKKTYERKLNEILLALRIESELSKDKILELYLNKIYLGNRAYGVGAAARVYYGKDVADLTLAEAAMIAGLPKAPSRYNPIVNPTRALLRRDYVLRRMAELQYITAQMQQETAALPVTASLHYSRPGVEANYVAEMVRSRLLAQYGDQIYTAGLRVFTTLDAPKQTAGNQALRRALIDYEKRHGFTGAIGYVDIDDALAEAIPGGQHQESDNDDALADGSEPPSSPGEAVLAALEKYAAYGNLYPAAVVSVVDDRAHLLLKDGRWGEVRLEDSLWARERLAIDKVGPELAGLGDVLGVGDVVYLEATEEADAFLLSQLPGIEGALVSVDPRSGAVLALVGGFDFHRSKFNRVTQARRQPGSNFKPFIYSAAMEFGDTAATIYNDAPVVFHDSALEGEWRPENYSGRFFGPTRLREALVKSRNLVSIRVLRRLGFRRTLNYVERFGFESSSLPTDLSLALGSGAVSPWQLVTAYSVFANQGYLVAPHFIDRIEDAWGKPVFLAPEVQLCDAACQADAETAESEEADDVSEAVPESLLSVGVDQPALNVSTETQMVADVDPSMGEDVKPLLERDVYKAPLVIDERNAYIMNSIMREVITRGTARKAKVLKRSDVAGKTGTTNDQHDAWFSGFTNQVATSVWLGYDELAPLGARETGGQAALPMWIDYMSQALQGTPEDLPSQPPELVTVRIDRKTGELTTGRNPASMFEFFRVEMAPQNLARQTAPAAPGHQRAGVAGRREPALENEEPLF